MLKKRIFNLLIDTFHHIPTQSQEELFLATTEFLAENNFKEVLIVKGYAGTGKTECISAIINALQTLRFRSVLVTPTGRAAKVLAARSGKTVSTIHKKIYRQKSAKDSFGEFVLDKNLHKNTIFIVDEASMIGNSGENKLFGSGDLLGDLLKYVYSSDSCKLIMVGDTAQLPPVGLSISPALESATFLAEGIDVKETYLRDVVRQQSQSGILANATGLRAMVDSSGPYLPKIATTKFNDVIKLSGADLIEEISSSYDKHGIEDSIIICRSNKRANKFNEGIRNSILWREEQLTVGDLVMVVKNSYSWVEDFEELDFIANGDILKILKIKGYQELYGYRFADVTVSLLDYKNLEIDTKIILNTLSIETASLNYEDQKKLYFSIAEDYPDIKNKRALMLKIRENSFFNALQVKFAYAITCHKAQGGQWKNVFIDHGYLTDDMINKDFLRWLYTAFTRATDKVYLVNFKKDFFSNY